MTAYRVIIPRTVQKQLDDLPAVYYARVVKRLVDLENDPRPVGAIKMKGSEQTYRLRIGDYRLVYDVDDANRTVALLACKHRRDVYRA